jgi:outer membrane lipoprotein-sorting protein
VSAGRARQTATALGAVLLLAAGLCAPQMARGDAVDDALARIEAARARVQTLAADFDQERTMGLFAQTLHAQGHLLVRRPDAVRWETLAPAGVFVVSAGRVAYRAGASGASASQAQAGPLGAVLADLASFLGGPLRPLRARYRIETSATPTGGLTLVAAPTEPAVARVVSRVTLVFRPDLAAIESIDMDEPGGDRTHIQLRNVRVNAPVAPSAFAP